MARTIVHVDDRSNITEAINRFYARDVGATGSPALVVWRNTSAGDYILDADNAGGKHANFGSGVLTVQDSGVGASVDLSLTTGKALILWNAGNTNSANLYHSGTNDILKTDDGLWAAGALGVGVTPSGLGAGDALLAGNPAWRSGGAFAVTLDHAATAARTITVPDATDTLALLGTAQTFTALDTFGGGATFTAGQTVTGNGTVQFKTPLSAAASGALTLTAAFQDITGASLSLAPGVWLVTGVFSLDCAGSAADVGQIGIGQLATSGGTATVALSTATAVLTFDAALTRATVAQSWLVTVTATTTATLQAKKTGGAGASIANQTHTTITATNA